MIQPTQSTAAIPFGVQHLMRDRNMCVYIYNGNIMGYTPLNKRFFI